MNGISWTSALDEIFNANRHDDPTLSWQYFGSDKGFMRTHPGKMNINFFSFFVQLSLQLCCYIGFCNYCDLVLQISAKFSLSTQTI